MDRLDEQIESVTRQGNIEDVDLDKVEEHLGEEARREMEQLQQLIQQLEEAGYLRRKGDRLEITARGMRKLAQNALREVFSELNKDRLGKHDVFTRGMAESSRGRHVSFSSETRFDIDLHRSLFNSVARADRKSLSGYP